jgi:hypothetical protein
VRTTAQLAEGKHMTLVTLTLTEAEQFFWDHAGWAHYPDETPEHGRARCAIGLAEAERRLQRDESAEVTWEEDDIQEDDCDCGDDHGTRYGAILRKTVTRYDEMTGEPRKTEQILGSLWGITFTTGAPETDPYARVVAAELADEYL